MNLQNNLHKFNKNYSFLFVLFFLLSGFYSIPYLVTDPRVLFITKRIVPFLLLVGMTLSIDWNRVKKGELLLIFSIWGLIHLLSLIIYPITFKQCFLRIMQVVYAYIFIVFIGQKYADSSLKNLLKNFNPVVCAIAVVIIIFIVFIDSKWRISIYNGFSGNRVNFSIWLSQITFFIIIILFNCHKIKSKEPRTIFHVELVKYLPFICVAPILVLQVFTTGRLGVVATVSMICCYGSSNFRSSKGLVLSLLYCFFIIFISNFISPIDHGKNDIYRKIEVPSSILHIDFWTYNTHQKIEYPGSPEVNISPCENGKSLTLVIDYQKIYDWIDQLTSYRLQIFMAGISAITFKQLFIGVGVGNFNVTLLSGDVYAVHNVLLNTIGEIGIIGFIALFRILVIPLYSKSFNSTGFFVKFHYLICLVISLLQPEFILTQISTSTSFLIAYAYLCKASLTK